MMTWVEILRDAGLQSLFGGFTLMIVLFFVAAFRDPKGSEILAWSLNTQWAAGLRLLRAAGRTKVWGRLAAILALVGTACLTLAALLAVIRLFVDAPKG